MKSCTKRVHTTTIFKVNGYDLSINRYKETEYEKVKYESPKVLLQKIRADLDTLEGLLG